MKIIQTTMVETIMVEIITMAEVTIKIITMEAIIKMEKVMIYLKLEEQTLHL
jgi:hypothetical protein